MASLKQLVLIALFVAVAGVIAQARAPFSSPTSAPEPASEEAPTSSPPKHSPSATPASSPDAFGSVSSPPAPALPVRSTFVSTPASSPSEDFDEADAPAFGPGPSPDSFVDYEASDLS